MSGMRVGQVTAAVSLASTATSAAELDDLAAELARRLQACADAFSDEHVVGVKTRVIKETEAEIKARIMTYGPRDSERSE